jgi:hypothetical protein
VFTTRCAVKVEFFDFHLRGVFEFIFRNRGCFSPQDAVPLWGASEPENSGVHNPLLNLTAYKFSILRSS